MQMFETICKNCVLQIVKQRKQRTSAINKKDTNSDSFQGYVPATCVLENDTSTRHVSV